MVDQIKRKMFEGAAPKTAALMRDLEAIMDNPATDPKLAAQMRSLNSAFKEKMTLGTAVALEKAIASDPAFAAHVREAAIRNPKGLEEALPKVVANPNGLKAVIAGVPVPQQQASPVQVVSAPAESAPQNKASTTPGPGVLSAVPPMPEGVGGFMLTSVNGETPALVADVARKGAHPDDPRVSEIMNANGFIKFMVDLESVSPQAYNTLSEYVNGRSGDPATREKVIAGIHARIQENPNFFVDAQKAMKENPGMAKTVIDQIVENPERGLQKLDMAMQMNQGGLMGMFKMLMQPGGLQNIIGMLKEMMTGFIQQVKSLFSGSTQILTDNPALAARTAAAVGSDPAVRKAGEDEFRRAADRDSVREMERQQQQRTQPGANNVPGANMSPAPDPMAG